MDPKDIASHLISPLKFPRRLKTVIGHYVLALAMRSPKHSQNWASQLSGLHKAQFSRLLKFHGELATQSLHELGKISAKGQKRGRLLSNAPWTAAIIIDSTLHGRSSLHMDNVQRFNHGGGFVVGHQWTNILLVLGDRKIPLPPLAFMTKKSCRKRKIPYESELTRVATYIRELDLSKYLGPHENSEIVVLMDSGYDCKKIQNEIIAKGWDFVMGLKPQRHGMSGKKWHKIRELFRINKRWAPQQTVVTQTTGTKKKRRKFSTRRLDGYLKGVHTFLSLVCSKKSRGKEKRYLACSNPEVSTKAILKIYACRWGVEIFHREVKQDLGLMDAGVKKFDSLQSHVHWVYCTYLLLKSKMVEKDQTIREYQREIEKNVSCSRLEKILKRCYQFGSQERVKRYCFEAIEEIKAA